MNTVNWLLKETVISLVRPIITRLFHIIPYGYIINNERECLRRLQETVGQKSSRGGGSTALNIWESKQQGFKRSACFANDTAEVS